MSRKSVQRGMTLGVLILLSMCLGAADVAESALLKFIPFGTEYVIALNVERLRKLPAMQRAVDADSTAEESGFIEDQVAAFEDLYQLKLADCRDLIFVGGGKRLRGVLIDLAKPESELSQAFRSRGAGYEKITVKAHPVHLLADETLASFGASKIGLSYLAPQTVLVTEQEYLAPFFDGLLPAEAARRAAVITPAGTPLAWAYFNVAAMTAKKKKKDQTDFIGAFFKDIRNIGVELDYAGLADKEWRLQAVALCVNAKSAETMRSTLPTYLMLAVNLLLANDPELGMNLIKATNIAVDGNRVTLEMEIPAALAERLGNYLAAESDRRMISPDPVPADIRQEKKPAVVAQP